MLLGLAHGVLAVVKHARREHGVRAALHDALDKMIEVAYTAARDYRDRERVGEGAGQLEIEAAACAVAIHTREQDFAGTGRLHPAAPFQRVEPGRAAATVREHLPARRARPRDALRVHRHHDALRAVASGRLFHQLRPLHRGRVDAHLVGAGIEQPPHVLDGAHAATHREGNKDLCRHGLDHPHDQIAPLARCGNVEERELVCALLIVTPRDFHRIAGVAQPDEIDAFHHAPGGDVEAGNDALRETHGVTGDER